MKSLITTPLLLLISSKGIAGTIAIDLRSDASRQNLKTIYKIDC